MGSNRFRFELISSSLRLHFDFTSDSLRFHFELTSNSLRLSFDLTSISHGEKGKTPCHTREKGKLGGSKGKRENSLPSFELEFHLASIPRARTNETKRFPGRSHPPTSDVTYIYMHSCQNPSRLMHIVCNNSRHIQNVLLSCSMCEVSVSHIDVLAINKHKAEQQYYL